MHNIKNRNIGGEHGAKGRIRHPSRGLPLRLRKESLRTCLYTASSVASTSLTGPRRCGQPIINYSHYRPQPHRRDLSLRAVWLSPNNNAFVREQKAISNSPLCTVQSSSPSLFPLSFAPLPQQLRVLGRKREREKERARVSDSGYS